MGWEVKSNEGEEQRYQIASLVLLLMKQFARVSSLGDVLFK